MSEDIKYYENLLDRVREKMECGYDHQDILDTIIVNIEEGKGTYYEGEELQDIIKEIKEFLGDKD